MVADFEHRLQREIRKRAFASWDRLRQEKQRRQDIQNTLDALDEVTELPRSELEAIARDVRLSWECHDENFFSIRNQILVACAIFGIVLTFGWLLINV